MSETNVSVQIPRCAPLYRRLMAMFYDLLLVTAILFGATVIVLLLNGGDAVGPDHPWYWWYVAYLAVISFTYYAWFWTHGGATPGMKTWRMRLVREGGYDITAAMLYAGAALLSWSLAGAGYLVALLHPRRRTLHDILTGSEMRDLRED